MNLTFGSSLSSAGDMSRGTVLMALKRVGVDNSLLEDLAVRLSKRIVSASPCGSRTERQRRV